MNEGLFSDGPEWPGVEPWFIDGKTGLIHVIYLENAGLSSIEAANLAMSVIGMDPTQADDYIQAVASANGYREPIPYDEPGRINVLPD